MIRTTAYPGFKFLVKALKIPRLLRERKTLSVMLEIAKSVPRIQPKKKKKTLHVH